MDRLTLAPASHDAGAPRHDEPGATGGVEPKVCAAVTAFTRRVLGQRPFVL
jgi:hypothetical protein